ncbi:MAG: hypothetical protein EPN33_15220 [Acidobacteria bacterium]|nr:MAG: hypothetical protein EPN33_15220 [Acidobacteriota bacterium]
MAGRSGPTFQKRQKEKQRQERQREKIERRSARKQDRAAGVPSSNNEIDYSFNPYEGMDELTDEVIDRTVDELLPPPHTQEQQ